MASHDIQIKPIARLPNSPSPAAHQSHMTAAGREPTSPAAEIVMGVLRRRWWLLLLIAFASGGAAIFVALQLGGQTAITNATLIYTGLPKVSTSTVYEPLSPTTCSELIVSVGLLERLRQSRGWEISPADLRLHFEPKVVRNSSYLSITFEWPSAEDAIDTLNELLSLFVEHVATQRRETLMGHIQHVELAVLQARTEVDDIQQQLNTLRERQQQLLDEGGLAGEQYRSLLARTSGAELAIDEKRVEQAGIVDQITALRTQIDGIEQEKSKRVKSGKLELGRVTISQITQMQSKYAGGSPAYGRLATLLQSLSTFVKLENEEDDLNTWRTKLDGVINENNAIISEADIAKLQLSYAKTVEIVERSQSELDEKRKELLRQKQNLDLSLIPVEKQIGMLEARLASYREQASALTSQMMNNGDSNLTELESRLEGAQSKQRALSSQLESMRELEKCRVNEWTVSTPASIQTTAVSSNRKRLFAFVFGLCAVVLSSPVVLAEWHRQRKAPTVAFAHSLQLPVLAERMLQDFLPRGRKRANGSEWGPEQLETLRSLTLRIQQSAHRPGAVILFSSLDSECSSIPLVGAIAKCLAEREERVLLVDAVCPSKSSLRLVNLLAQLTDADAAISTRKHDAQLSDKSSGAPGLAEYLSEECESVADLISPSGCPGVDIISSGSTSFPREAMASSCLTQLIESCRRNYTMILVNGPGAIAIADTQMLAARADGVVLTATRRVKGDSQVRSAVVDLIELGAPIIGIVA